MDSYKTYSQEKIDKYFKAPESLLGANNQLAQIVKDRIELCGILGYASLLSRPVAGYGSILFYNGALSFTQSNNGYVGTRSLGYSSIPYTDFDLNLQCSGSGQTTGVPILHVVVSENPLTDTHLAFTTGFRITFNHLGNVNTVIWSDGSYSYNSTSTGKNIKIKKRNKQVTITIDSVDILKDASANFGNGQLSLQVFMGDSIGSYLYNGLSIIQ